MEHKDSYNIVVDVDDTHLDFQDFAGNSALNNNVLHDYPAQQAQPPNPTANGVTSGSVWEISYWSQYFNVDTNQVLKRCAMSLTLDKGFLEDINVNYFGPDLWGPFWIPTTVIYSIFVSMLLSISLSSALGYEKNTLFNFSTLSSAVLLIYSYVSLVPVALSFIMKYFGSNCSIVEILTIYGYSTTIWVLVPIVCMFPNSIIRWIAVCAGFAVSGIFLFRNVTMISERSNTASNPIVVIGMFLMNMVLAVSMKLLFFSYTAFSK